MVVQLPAEKMLLVITLCFYVITVLSGVQSNDECCYIYGSVPRNESNCVPEGEQLSLSYIIYNPHDMFTNLSVTWLKSITRDMSSYEMISDIHITRSTHAISLGGNCPLDVYRDQFDIRINNFNINENGYYWCQMSINNTNVQPSDHAFFYAANATNCNPYRPYFRPTISNEHKCARYLNTSPASSSIEVIPKLSTKSPTISSAMTVTRRKTSISNTPETKSPITMLAMTTTITRYNILSTAVSSMTLATRSTTISFTMTSAQHETPSERSIIIYITGSLSALVLILGTLVIILSIMYLCKFKRRKPITQKNQQGETTSNDTMIQSCILSRTGIQKETAVDSSKNAQTTTQEPITEDDIYSTVSDDSFERVNSPSLDAQETHALPHEVAIFHDQNQAIDIQKPQENTTDSKPALKPGASDDTHNPQYLRENQSDECHIYDKVEHELKEEQSQSSTKVLLLVSDHAGDDSELFDDVVYSSSLSSNYDTKRSVQQPDANMRNQQMNSPEGSILPQTSTKFTRERSEYERVETVQTKEHNKQLSCSDEHVYDSADQLSQGQTKLQVAQPVTGERFNSLKWEADKKEHIHRTLESQESSQGGGIDPRSHTLANCSPIQCNCQFDDPMYGSNIQPKAATTQSSIKAGAIVAADVIEVQENGSTTQGNPEFVLICDGDPENFTNVPQCSDPTDLASIDNNVTMDSQDEADRNLTSIYDMFDDPTYGVCHAGSNKITENIH